LVIDGQRLKGNQMIYTIKAHPTLYAGTMFRSRLEARWAAFFDLKKWKWEYEPIDLDGWTPDFRVELPHCGDELGWYLASVKPFYTIDDFDRDPQSIQIIDAYHRGEIPELIAWLGINPSVSEFDEWCDSSGGRVSLFYGREDLWKSDWARAGNIVQWVPKRKLLAA
jgi:hypothetical protein